MACSDMGALWPWLPIMLVLLAILEQLYRLKTLSWHESEDRAQHALDEEAESQAGNHEPED